jgi:hypothetical protein
MYSEKDWQTFLRNPLTNRLVLYARDEARIPLYISLDFEEFMPTNFCYSKCVTNESIHNYDSMERSIEEFAYFLETNNPKSILLCITFFLSEYLRETKVFKQNELPEFIQLFCDNSFIASCLLDRDETDLILYALTLEQIHIDGVPEEEMDHRMDLLAQKFYEVRKESRRRIKERMDIIKEELMAAVWHPRRVERMLEEGGWEAVEAM